MVAIIPAGVALAGALGVGSIIRSDFDLDRVFSKFADAWTTGQVVAGTSDIFTTPSPKRRRGPKISPPKVRKKLRFIEPNSAVAGKSRLATMAVTKRKFKRKNASIGRLAYKKVRRIERAIEKKVVYTESTGINLPGQGTTSSHIVAVNLAPIGSGNGANGRIGYSISPRMLTLNMCFRNTDTASHCVRLVIVQTIGLDTEPRNYFDADIIDDPLSRYLAPKGKDCQFRFRTLYDNIISLSAGVTNTFPLQLRLSNLRRISYDGTATTDHSTGQIYMMMIRDVGDTGSDVKAHWVSKLSYIDL